MTVRVLQGDCRDVLRTIPDTSVHCCVTSPPYWRLRDYGASTQIGLEQTPDAYVAELVAVFRDVRRVLRNDGTLWLNLGDSYAANRSYQVPDSKHIDVGNYRATRVPLGLKPKDLIGIPWRAALALQADGWYLRSALPWIKRGVMPESIEDRPSSAVEYVFLLTKQPHYYWDFTAVMRAGAIPAGTRAAKGSNVRSDLKDVNGRPPEYWEYTGTRNFRNSDLFFDSLDAPHGLICNADGEPIALDVNPMPLKEAHFAAFPPRLVEPFVKAGTSERGCCPHCSAPWMREVEHGITPGPKAAKTFVIDGRDAQADKNDQGSNRQKDGHKPGYQSVNKTLGWHQTCRCPPHEPGRATILDPFFGAGTTGLVADRLGRDCIGIELNEEYCEIARSRVKRDAPLFAEIYVEAKETRLTLPA